MSNNIPVTHTLTKNDNKVVDKHREIASYGYWKQMEATFTDGTTEIWWWDSTYGGTSKTRPPETTYSYYIKKYCTNLFRRKIYPEEYDEESYTSDEESDSPEPVVLEEYGNWKKMKIVYDNNNEKIWWWNSVSQEAQFEKPDTL